ncbi:MAG TPA: patatin-like phospholipase family protein [Vicinamibacterales bacterium]|jgi:NTE family protein|nr:patatin-like phospholipase family protein [Vicinamibacterales bacterium]
MKSALVLSGGGANGAYEVGVLKGLATGRSKAFGGSPLGAIHAVAATSIGAFNAGVLLSNFEGDWNRAVAALESAWLDRIAPENAGIGNGVFRYRPNFPEWLNPLKVAAHPVEPAKELVGDAAFLVKDWAARLRGFAQSSDGLVHRFAELIDLSSFIQAEPSDALVDATVSPAKVRASSIEVRVTATEWRSGTLRVFENKDFTDTNGRLIVRASGAIPGIFPSVDIGGAPYVDGGVVMNTPLSPAIHTAADTLHVIYLDPAPGAIPLRAPSSTIDAMGRMFVASFAATMRRDLEVAAGINRDVEKGTDRKRRPLTIHLYHPLEDTGGALGMLDFHRPHVSRLIDLGYKNALAHDCRQSGCIIPHE